MKKPTPNEQKRFDSLLAKMDAQTERFNELGTKKEALEQVRAYLDHEITRLDEQYNIALNKQAAILMKAHKLAIQAGIIHDFRVPTQV